MVQGNPKSFGRIWETAQRVLVIAAVLAVAQLQGQWVSCAGTGSLTCTSSKVGIGTTTPGTGDPVMLDVVGGDIRAVAPNTGFVVQAPDYWNGGWARGFSFTNSNDAVLAQFGANGSGAPSFLNYAYIGTSPFSPRITFKPNGNVGIGTAAPLYPLDVSGSSRVAANGFGGVTFEQQAYPSQGALLFSSDRTGYTFTIGSKQRCTLYSSPSCSEGSVLPIITMYDLGKVGIGTTTPKYPLSVNGTVGATEVVVTSGVSADYVFAPGYHLATLSEVDAFIQQNHHLPDIPSAAAVKATGVNVGEMQAKLLAKIEELTLHVIQGERRNDTLEQENRQLRDRMALLEEGAQRNRE